MKKYLTIIFILSLVSLWPFFNSGFFTTHDGEWMIIRFSAFHQSLISGQIPVRFVKRLNNNYGYPVLNFLYPGPFYMAEIPKILGFSYINSIKITFILSTITSSLLMFWALSLKFSKLSSFTGAVVYLYIPYRFVDLYVRGSLGESVAFALIPAVFGSILKLSSENTFFFPIVSLSVAAFILSHNVIAVLFMPIFISIAFLHLNRKLFTKALLYIVLGIAISAFFIIPALYDLKYVRLSQIKISDATAHLVPITKLIYSKWSYGPNPNSIYGFSTQLGICAIIVFILSLYLQFKHKRKDKVIVFITLLFPLSVFLISAYSKPFWQFVPHIDIIQFPWRLLSIIVFTAALLSAFIADRIKKTWVSISLVSISILTTVTFIKPSQYTLFKDSYYSTNEDTTTVRDEYLPLWIKEKPKERANTNTIPDPNVIIVNEEQKGVNYHAQINAQKDSNLTLNTIYFPGFSAKIDSQEATINYQNPNGLINIKLPKGIHEVIIDYNNTAVHMLSELVSLLALSLTTALFFCSRYGLSQKKYP